MSAVHGIDTSWLGVEVEAGPFDVTPEAVQAFCRVVGETHPIFTDAAEAQRQGYRGLVAPPVMLVLQMRQAPRPGLVAASLGPRLHTSLTLEMKAPLCAGERLTARVRLQEAAPRQSRRGAAMLAVWETRFLGQDGQEVAVVRESYLHW